MKPPRTLTAHHQVATASNLLDCQGRIVAKVLDRADAEKMVKRWNAFETTARKVARLRERTKKRPKARG